MFLMCNLFYPTMINGVFQKNKELHLSVAKKVSLYGYTAMEITTEFKDNKCTNTILSQTFRAPVLTGHFPEGFCFQVVGFGQMTFVSLKGFPA